MSGVQIFEEQVFVYTGKKLDFIWEDAGISLHFVTANCERDIDIAIKVVTDIEEICVSPPGYELGPMVSPVYRIKAGAKLPALARVTIKHSAQVDEETSLVHMVAHGGPPYHFKPMEGGKFPLGESYGEIEMNQFCLITIIENIFKRRSLAFHVAYLEHNIVHFMVTKNIPAHCDAVRARYGTSIKSYPMRYSYKATEIQLAIKEPYLYEGWQILPTSAPQIALHNIHDYQPGSAIPKIELQMEWKNEGQPQERNVKIDIQGGTIKYYFTLSCKLEEQRTQQKMLTPPSAERTASSLQVQCGAAEPGITSIKCTNQWVTRFC